MEKDYLFDITYPDEEEIKAAQLACCGRVCSECESPAAYAWRKREVDLALLLEKAIENELTETEKKVVEDKWYNSLSFSQIARNRGISPAAVRRTSERALEKLESVLQYVVFYQRNVTDESIVPASVARARVIASSKNEKAENICRRLRNLRVGNGFSLNSLCAATEISEKRLEEIEKGDDPKIHEIILLSNFFAVTTDFLLKGENNV